MKQPKYGTKHLILSALAGGAAALGAAFLALCLVLGPDFLGLAEAWGVIRFRFVEDYDPGEAADSALAGLVDGLGNRWSYYLTAEELEEQESRRANRYVGVGITVSYEDPRGLLLVSVREDGPAGESGLMPGEIITAVDGVSLAGEGQKEGTKLIRGEEGTEVNLTVLSQSGARREVKLIRRSLESPSVTGARLLSDGTGYIRLKNFYTGSSGQLNAAVDRLVEEGATALVFDMRNNGGGYISELTSMLDHLLPEGEIFRLKYKNGKEEITHSDPSCVDLPMAVLVNGDTYSAAEFFAAQLRESVGAAVVGEPTSGKGNSQQSFKLITGGALNISTGRYCTGAGVSLVGTGVTLDARVELDEEAEAALAADVLAEEEDLQLQKALELLKRT